MTDAPNPFGTTGSDHTTSPGPASASAGVVTAVGAAAPITPTSTPRNRVLKHFLKGPANLTAAAFLILELLACLLARLVAPYDPLGNDLNHSLEGPSSSHWLGTDQFGRDVLSRLLYGGQPVFLGVLEAAGIALLIGVPLGVTSGYFGGWFDAATSRIVDIWLSLPAIVILLLVLTVLGSSQPAAMVTLGFLFSPTLLRVARGATIAVRHELYIAAAQVFGLTSRQIMTRHVLPRITGPVVVNTAILMANLVLVQSGLAFLGLTVRPPYPSWGGMVTEAGQVLQLQPWLIIPSGAATALTVLAVIVVGDGIRDASQDARSTTADRSSKRPTPTIHTPIARQTDSTPALLSVRDIEVQLPLRTGWTTVIDGVSFDVNAGETVGLVGESGSGKSVTALSILGLTPGRGRVTAGSILYNGQELRTLTPGQYRSIRGNDIAYVSQEPMASLDPCFTIGNQLREAVTQHEQLDGRALKARVIELLTLVGLPEPEVTSKRYPHQVSGGMAQRAVIARALAGRPRVLIADEPTTALDATVQREILKLLRTIKQDTGMAIILVTHDWGVVAQTCDRAIVMYAGQVVEQATVTDIFTKPNHPYTAALLGSDPHRAERGERIKSIEGTVPAPTDWPPGCRFAARCTFHLEACDRPPTPVHVSGDHTSRCVRSEELHQTDLLDIGRHGGDS